MTFRAALLSLLAILAAPAFAFAAEGAAPPLALPWWTAAPFVGLLLCIALLPLLAGHFWHKNRYKALVALLFSAPVVFYLTRLVPEGVHPLLHELAGYVSFIVLLGSLYVISGGIVLEGSIVGRPLTNTAFLGVGAVLANFIGTTGASMLLIRPFLRVNLYRRRNGHLPIFFIFMVSNVGGLLTPVGDPPLFLGYLRGVSFFWTLQLWPQWLLVNGLLLGVFLVWDTLAMRGEDPLEVKTLAETPAPMRLRGVLNFLFLAGVVGAVVLKSRLPTALNEFFAAEAFMALMALLSLLLTPRRLRVLNGFTWGPIIEVAVLFLGIFITMVPALELLKAHGPRFGLSEPWQFFWMTGALSSFLDNAPTYLTFGTLAASSLGLDSASFRQLMEEAPKLLAAISCGAVFMGAMTYIGNGPNFMVKAISDEAGVETPTFFGYMVYSCAILLPVFVLVTFVFFSP